MLQNNEDDVQLDDSTRENEILQAIVRLTSDLLSSDTSAVHRLVLNSPAAKKLGKGPGKLLFLKPIDLHRPLEIVWIHPSHSSAYYVTSDISSSMVLECFNPKGLFVPEMDVRHQINVRMHVYNYVKTTYPSFSPMLCFGEKEEGTSTTDTQVEMIQLTHQLDLPERERWKLGSVRKLNQIQVFRLFKSISKNFANIRTSMLKSQPVNETCKKLMETIPELLAFDPFLSTEVKEEEMGSSIGSGSTSASSAGSLPILNGNSLYEQTVRRLEEQALRAESNPAPEEEIFFSHQLSSTPGDEDVIMEEAEAMGDKEDGLSPAFESRSNEQRGQSPLSDPSAPRAVNHGDSNVPEAKHASFSNEIQSSQSESSYPSPKDIAMDLDSKQFLDPTAIQLELGNYVEELKEKWNAIHKEKHDAKKEKYLVRYSSPRNFDLLQSDVEVITEDRIPSLIKKISDRVSTVSDLKLLRTGLDCIVDDLCLKEYLLSLVKSKQSMETHQPPVAMEVDEIESTSMNEGNAPADESIIIIKQKNVTQPNQNYIRIWNTETERKDEIEHKEEVRKPLKDDGKVYQDQNKDQEKIQIKVKNDTEEDLEAMTDSESASDLESMDTDGDEDLVDFIVPDDVVEWNVDEIEQKQVDLLDSIRELFVLYPTEWELLNELKRFCLSFARNEPLPERAAAFLYIKTMHSLISKDLPETMSLAQSWHITYTRCRSSISKLEDAYMKNNRAYVIPPPVKKINISSSESNPVYIPSFLENVLQEHQIRGIRFLWEKVILKEGGCILAHAMGLGKSLQVVAFLFCLWNEVSKNKESIPVHLHPRRTLIVAPKTVLPQFKQEVIKWIQPEVLKSLQIKIFVLDGSRLERLHIVREWNELGGILFLTYDAVKSFTQPAERTFEDCDEAEMKRLLLGNASLVVLDEAHILKNHETQLYALLNDHLVTRSRIALTGTPLQNNLKECFNMTEIVTPGFLGTRDQFITNFLTKIMDGQSADSSRRQMRVAEYTLTLLQELLSEFILREDNQLLKDMLPPLREYVVYIDLTPAQRKLVLSFINSTDEAPHYLWQLGHSLIRIFNHPLSFFDNFSAFQTSFEPLPPTITLPHSTGPYTSRQGDTVSMTSAPNLINHLPSKDPTPSAASNEPKSKFRHCWAEAYKNDRTIRSLGASSKMLVCFQILELSRLKEEKVIIFSQCLKSLDYLQGELDRRNFVWCRMDGQTPSRRRQELINEFNSEVAINVFLISTKTGGTGVNLFSASRVIILDFQWNPTTEEQGIGRAYRIGQTRSVFVYRLVIPDTFEEAVLKRQLKKSALAQQMLDNKKLEKIFNQEKIRRYFERAEIKRRMNEKLCRIPYQHQHDVILEQVYQNVDYVVSVSEMQSFFPPNKSFIIEELHLEHARNEAQRLLQRIKQGLPWDEIIFPENLFLEPVGPPGSIEEFIDDEEDNESTDIEVRSPSEELPPCTSPAAPPVSSGSSSKGTASIKSKPKADLTSIAASPVSSSAAEPKIVRFAVDSQLSNRLNDVSTVPASTSTPQPPVSVATTAAKPVPKPIPLPVHAKPSLALPPKPPKMSPTTAEPPSIKLSYGKAQSLFVPGTPATRNVPSVARTPTKTSSLSSLTELPGPDIHSIVPTKPSTTITTTAPQVKPIPSMPPKSADPRIRPAQDSAKIDISTPAPAPASAKTLAYEEERLKKTAISRQAQISSHSSSAQMRVDSVPSVPAREPIQSAPSVSSVVKLPPPKPIAPKEIASSTASTIPIPPKGVEQRLDQNPNKKALPPSVTKGKENELMKILNVIAPLASSFKPATSIVPPAKPVTITLPDHRDRSSSASSSSSSKSKPDSSYSQAASSSHGGRPRPPRSKLANTESKDCYRPPRPSSSSSSLKHYQSRSKESMNHYKSSYKGNSHRSPPHSTVSSPTAGKSSQKRDGSGGTGHYSPPMSRRNSILSAKRALDSPDHIPPAQNYAPVPPWKLPGALPPKPTPIFPSTNSMHAVHENGSNTTPFPPSSSFFKPVVPHPPVASTSITNPTVVSLLSPAPKPKAPVPAKPTELVVLSSDDEAPMVPTKRSLPRKEDNEPSKKPNHYPCT